MTTESYTPWLKQGDSVIDRCMMKLKSRHSQYVEYLTAPPKVKTRNHPKKLSGMIVSQNRRI